MTSISIVCVLRADIRNSLFVQMYIDKHMCVKGRLASINGQELNKIAGPLVLYDGLYAT